MLGRAGGAGADQGHNVQKNAPYTAREACEALCARVHAEPVQTIGNRFSIYRQARENSKIHLDEL